MVIDPILDRKRYNPRFKARLCVDNHSLRLSGISIWFVRLSALMNLLMENLFHQNNIGTPIGSGTCTYIYTIVSTCTFAFGAHQVLLSFDVKYVIVSTIYG